LAKRYHPDLSGTEETASEFTEVKDAWDRVSEYLKSRPGHRPSQDGQAAIQKSGETAKPSKVDIDATRPLALPDRQVTGEMEPAEEPVNEVQDADPGFALNDEVRKSFSVLDSETRRVSQLNSAVSALRGTSQKLMDVNKFRLCLPIEVLKNSPDITLALKGAGLLRHRLKDTENIEFELVVTGVAEKDLKLIDGLNRDNIKKALNLPKKFTISTITEAQIQHIAGRFGYDASNSRHRIAIIKDFFAGTLGTEEYMAIVTDAIDTTEQADVLKDELKRELQDELAKENISIRVLVRPEDDRGIYSLSSIINDWLEAINRGDYSTISRILPIPVPLTPELERAMKTAWEVLIAA
jgi:hypothetical protein